MIPIPLIEAAIGLVAIGVGVIWLAVTNHRARKEES